MKVNDLLIKDTPFLPHLQTRNDCQKAEYLLDNRTGIIIFDSQRKRTCMKNDWKEYLLYPVITALVCVGVIAFGDWRRGTLESFWWYALAALLIYAAMTISKCLLQKQRSNGPIH